MCVGQGLDGMEWDTTSLSLSLPLHHWRGVFRIFRALDPMRLNFGGGKVLRAEVTRPGGHYERTKRG